MAEPRILMTGATGFIGRALCERYGNHRTWTAIGRSSPTEMSLPVGFRRVDLREPLPVDVVPEGTDVLVLLAAHRAGEKDVVGHFEGTFASTLHLCEAARRARVRRIVLVSSTSVYEPLPAGRSISEEDRRVARRPLTYGFAKKWAEDAARLEALLAEPPMQLWVLRPGMVVGPGLRKGAFLRTTVARLKAGEPYPLTGEHGHYLGLVALDDVVEALIHAIGSEPQPGTLPPGPVWNLVGEQWWERELVEHLGKAVGVVPQFIAPTAVDPFGWNVEPLSVAGDGARWIREAGGIRPRPIAPLLEQVARSC